jgi:hypothetical protein
LILIGIGALVTYFVLFYRAVKLDIDGQSALFVEEFAKETKYNLAVGFLILAAFLIPTLR